MTYREEVQCRKVRKDLRLVHHSVKAEYARVLPDYTLKFRQFVLFRAYQIGLTFGSINE